MSDPIRRGSSRGTKPRFDDLDEPEEPRSRTTAKRGPARPVAGARRKPAQPGFLSRLFGGADERRRRPRSRAELDWDYAQDDVENDDRPASAGRYSGESWDEPPKSQRPSRRPRKLSLMDLCTPVFAYSSVLPRDAVGMHPSYTQFRNEVLSALQKIESEAAESGIEREDAQDAAYALSLFLDEAVAASEWNGKAQWADEPLYAVKLQDPEGGINFFRKLDEMGERRNAVKEVFLVCLAMGFRGKYAELEPTQQAAKLGEIRQRVLRSLHPTPLDEVEELFPEAYEPAQPLSDDAPPPPKWWITASFAVVALAVIVYALLLWAASGAADEPAKKLEAVTVSQVIR